MSRFSFELDMASNSETTAAVQYFEIGPNGGCPLSDGELWVSFVLVKPEHPEEEETIPVRVHRSLISSEESAKTIIPLLLSRTALPDLFHHCPVFIRRVSEYVRSLSSHTPHVYIYSDVVWDDVDPPMSVWFYCLSTEELSNAGELLESAVEAVNDEVEVEEGSECAICLQGLVDGIEAQAAKLPCSHVYHRDCIVKWFDASNQCPLCRYQLPKKISSFLCCVKQLNVIINYNAKL